MISYLKGQIREKDKSFVTLENQGIGFKIFVSEKTLKEINVDEQREFFIFYAVRKEKPELYGFLDKQGLKVFEIIEAVSGIGPKGALLISSLGSIDELKKAVEENDSSYFSKVKGIGRKKVQKIILELGGNLKDETLTDDEALKALIALGFSKKEGQKALDNVPKEIKETKQRIQTALQFFNT